MNGSLEVSQMVKGILHRGESCILPSVSKQDVRKEDKAKWVHCHISNKESVLLRVVLFETNISQYWSYLPNRTFLLICIIEKKDRKYLFKKDFWERVSLSYCLGTHYVERGNFKVIQKCFSITSSYYLSVGKFRKCGRIICKICSYKLPLFPVILKTVWNHVFLCLLL